MTPPAILECNAVTKRFGKLTALQSVSFDLQPGEFIALFGRNGAGKSTLLNIVASLIRSFEGRVSMFGTDLRDSDENTRRRLGYISHDSFLYGDLTARENLLFYARMYGVDVPARAADDMLARVGLTDKASVTVRALSRGMTQRLSLARAFLHGPQLLLLDEPYTGLDETSSTNLDNMLVEFASGGGSVLMTTHDIDRGFRLSRRALILDGGVLVYNQPKRDVDLAAFREKYREVLAR